MTVFSSNINHRSFTWQLTALSFLLGLILAATWYTATQISHAGNAPVREGFVYGAGDDTATHKLIDYQSEISHLRNENQSLSDELAKRKGGAETINQELKDARKFAGLTDILGPGVKLTLVDNVTKNVSAANPVTLGNLIHDVDLREVVNELDASGAEAISINDQRIVAGTSIRCVGPVIQVNGIPTAPPYVVLATGDPATLANGMSMEGGLLQQLRAISPNMVHLQKMTRVHLPPFGGSTRMTHSHVPAQVQTKSGEEN